jgi:type IV pilus assembly protein PilA
LRGRKEEVLVFLKFHAARERRDEAGFTLIELLVVILIIAILAAIAIPVFLRQREKGWRSQMDSALKNAATAQESFATGNNGAYTNALANLTSEGLKYAADVTLTIVTPAAATGTTYCMQATHAQLSGETHKLNSGVGAPQSGSCP